MNERPTPQIIDLISEVKWEQTKKFILDGDFTTAWLWTFAYSSVFLVMSALLVAYQPAAAGSGIPEIIGFLNGTRIKDIFKVQYLVFHPLTGQGFEVLR